MMRRCVVLAACLTLGWLELARCQEPPAAARPQTGEQPALRFRRVYAPAASLKDWPLGNQPYLPMDAQEFERLVRAAHRDDAGEPRSSGALLSKAAYRGTLHGNDLLEGQATLTIEHRRSKPAMLPLEPLGLAISDPAWVGAEPRPPALGLNADGRRSVLVEQSGDLKFNWSLRGERTPAGDIAFRFELPVCVAGQLVVDLPAGMILNVDGGLLREAERPADGLRRWQIELGAIHRLLLRIGTAEAAGQRKALALVRQSTAFEFSPRGADVAVQLRLDVHNAPLDRLVLAVDPRLQLVGARYADRDVPWTSSPGPGGAGTQVTLEFPEPIAGTGRIVRLAALAPLAEGKPWRLPTVRVADATWLEGTTQIVVPKPLVIEQIAATGCRQSKAEPLSAPLAGEALEFQCFGPDAALDVVLGRPREPLHVDMASAVELGPVEITARAVVQLSLRQGERFVLRGEISPQWLIDSVDASPADLIDDWQIESREAHRQRLVVRLRKGVSPRRPLRLIVSGHRPSAAGQVLAASDLEMLHFPRAKTGKQWLALRATEGHELQTEGADDLTRLDPQQFTPAESELFVEPPAGMIVAIGPAAGALRVGTAPRKPGYSGEIDVDLVVDGSTLTETYTLRCAPQAARVERLLLFCSHARSEPLKFHLAGASSGQVTAKRRRTANFTAQGAAAGGEVWELTLRLPRSGPFEVRGTRTVPLEGRLPVSLAALPEAVSQRGTLVIRALGEAGVGIENVRLKPVPAELLQPDFFQTARGAYRFEPARDAASPDPAITIAPLAPNPITSGAWAWQARLDTRYALRDSTVHVASWRLQTAGRGRVWFTLPAGADLRGIAVDDAPLSEAVWGLFSERFSIDLPPGKQFATITIDFATAGELPRVVRSVRPAWPEIDVPVLDRRWSVWLPAGYRLAESDSRWQSPPLPEPGWTERLFGPLGRTARDATFDAFSAQDWSSLAGQNESAAGAQLKRETLLAALEAALRPADRQPPTTWGGLATVLAGQLSTSGSPMLADLPGLQRAGVTPDTPLPPFDPARPLVLFDRARLLVLYHHQAWVLTSDAEASFYCDDLISTASEPTAVVAPGSLADELSAAVERGATRWVPLARWPQGAALSTAPWRPELALQNPSWESRGWTGYRLTNSEPDSERPVSIVRVSAVESLGWGAFLLALALCIGNGAGRAAYVLAGLLVATALALWVSAAWVPITSGACLGVLCGVLFWIIDRRPQSVAARSTRARPALSRATALMFALAGAALGALGLGDHYPASAAESTAAAAAGPEESGPRPAVRSETAVDPAAESKSTAAVDDSSPRAAEPRADSTRLEPVAGSLSEVHQVFVPIDDAQQPVGTRVYVSESLHKALLGRSAAAAEQSGDWLLTRAMYRVVLARDGAQQRIGVSELKASFDLHVLRPGVDVRIALGHDAVSLVEGSVKLDGRTLDIRWPAGAGGLSFRSAEAGVFRLELSLEPTLNGDGTSTGFELAVPPLAQSSLQVNWIGEPAPIEAIAARGRSQTSPGGELQVELGPSGRLGLRWPDEKSQTATLPNLDVEELLWVKLQPGSPVVDARFKFRVLEGKVRRLRILADPRLRLLPSANADSVITGIHTSPGDPATIDLDLAPTAGGAIVVDLTFLVSGTSGIGNFRLPQLHAAGARLVNRLLAVSVDPALHFDEQVGDEVEPLTAADFLAAWGPTDVRPQLADSIPRGEAAWVLATRPREVRNVVEQSVTVGLSAGLAKIRCEAAINTTAGHQFQVRVNGPPGFEIDSASLLEDGVQRLARWARDDAGAITVFLTGPVTGRQQFVLTGQLKTPESGEFNLPAFQWPGSELKRNQLQVWRQPSTLVDIPPAVDLSGVELPPGEANRPEMGRLVGCYALENSQTSVRMTLAQNNPQTTASQLIVVERDRESWTASVEFHQRVDNGVVDVLRFDIPPQWIEPFQFDRNVKFEVRAVPGESRRELILYPAVPLTSDYRVRIKARLTPAMSDRLRAPDVVPRGVTRLERYVALPNRWEGQELVWELAGLTPGQLPSDWQKSSTLAAPGSIFQAPGAHFQATLKSIERATGRPRVRLAEMLYIWQSDASCYGVALFDLDPAGATQASLSLPPQLELVHLSVSGLPATAVPAGPETWRFALGPPQLPERVEVVFRGLPGAVTRQAGRVSLPAPALDGLAVDRTLWTVWSLASPSPGAPADQSGTLRPAQQEMVRMQSVDALLDSAAQVAGEQGPDELARWYTPWKRRFAAARERIQRLLPLANDAEAAPSPDVEALEREATRVGDRLNAASVPPGHGGAALEPAQLLMSPRITDASPVLCLAPGDSPSLALRYPAAPASRFWPALIVGLLLLTAAALVARSGARRWTWRVSPRRLVVALGLFWWLALAPSFVGFALVAGALVEMAARRWLAVSHDRPSTLPT